MAKAEGLTGKARVRVAPVLPYSQDFGKLPPGAVPGGYFAWRRPFGATGRSLAPERARLLWEASLAAVYGADAERSDRGDG